MAEDAGKEITIANDVDTNIFRIGISSPGCNDPYGEGAVVDGSSSVSITANVSDAAGVPSTPSPVPAQGFVSLTAETEGGTTTHMKEGKKGTGK